MDLFRLENTEDVIQNNKIFKRQPCEVYSRVVGFMRPVKNWNDAKKCEFKNRKTFKV